MGPILEAAAEDQDIVVDVEEEDDGWHWPTFLYIGLTVLNLTPEQFWGMRPITFISLLEARKYLAEHEDDAPQKIPKHEVLETTIDQAPSWW